ncbi:putative ABC transporter ATP-binding protein YknY [bacterium HR11]|nr:putative ABC transporter ATP-binding protein YknY [bacterium HR11]
MAFIECRQVVKEYPNGVRALDGVSLAIERGEWVAIMGPSGAGKSTLLHLIGGLDRPTAGEVWVDRIPVHTLEGAAAADYRRNYVGIIFQQFHLVPYLTALENVMLAQYFHSVPDEAQARRVLELVGLPKERFSHYPAQLSGGEQQRVAIARALVNDPPILLADEPTGSLDHEAEQTVLALFQRIHARGKTILLVTHAPHVARWAQRRIVLEHGRLVDVAEPWTTLQETPAGADATLDPPEPTRS